LASFSAVSQRLFFIPVYGKVALTRLRGTPLQ